MTQSNHTELSVSLPMPDDVALELSTELLTRIKARISQQGHIGFDEYMSTCLYEPGLGYYSAGSRKFGEAGDFTTAPEISSLFSRCIANQCVDVMNELDTVTILELGAGSGVMARDILFELERQGALPETYYILEVSADLKQRQQSLLKETLPHLMDRIQWLDALPDNSFDGLILANEVLDALPVKRFIKTNDTFHELSIGLNGDELCYIETPTNNALLTALKSLEDRLNITLPEQYVSEINLELGNWLNVFESILNKGLMLFIDYGYSESEYYHPQRHQGTLLCHYRHHVNDDVFFYPGLQDITSSVDFTLLAEQADASGLHVNGYTSQMYFLLANGLEGMVSNLESSDLKSQTELAQQIRTLTMPEEMGERFKVMALSKHYDKTLTGFSIMDQRVRL